MGQLSLGMLLVRDKSMPGVDVPWWSLYRETNLEERLMATATADATRDGLTSSESDCSSAADSSSVSAA